MKCPDWPRVDLIAQAWVHVTDGNSLTFSVRWPPVDVLERENAPGFIMEASISVKEDMAEMPGLGGNWCTLPLPSSDPDVAPLFICSGHKWHCDTHEALFRTQCAALSLLLT
jgi:hypothetical protein